MCSYVESTTAVRRETEAEGTASACGGIAAAGRARTRKVARAVDHDAADDVPERQGAPDGSE